MKRSHDSLQLNFQTQNHKTYYSAELGCCLATMNDRIDIGEYEALAKLMLPKMIFDFFAGGAEDEWTLRENKLAYAKIKIRPNLLVGVPNVDLVTYIMGNKISMPIMIAPTAMHKLAHPEGEIATATAAAATNTIMVVSTFASTSLEEIAASSYGIKFFQLYIYGREKALDLVRRAENAGYRALVLTVDTPMLGRRESDIRNRFALPSHVTIKNIEDVGDQAVELKKKAEGSQIQAFAAKHMEKSITWRDVKWLQSETKLPLLLKGILTAEDTKRALEVGVSGIIVSNHGGRQLDYAPATISVLEEVVLAAQRKVPVYIDGGIRTGFDVFRALALGANGVFVGRPVIFGLAVAGEKGVRNVLSTLTQELEDAMMLAGCSSIKDIGCTNIQAEDKILSARL